MIPLPAVGSSPTHRRVQVPPGWSAEPVGVAAPSADRCSPAHPNHVGNRQGDSPERRAKPGGVEGKPPTVLTVNAASGASRPLTAKAGEGADPISRRHEDGLGGRTARATGAASRLSEGCALDTTHNATTAVMRVLAGNSHTAPGLPRVVQGERSY